MRRKDRELSEEKAWEILKEGTYGVLSMSNSDIPYGVPISYSVYERYIYFHCAIEGKKSDFIDKNNNISFCVVTKSIIDPVKFTVYYESAIVTGKAEKLSNLEDKREALSNFTESISPGSKEQVASYPDKVFNKLNMYKMSVDKITGKANYE